MRDFAAATVLMLTASQAMAIEISHRETAPGNYQFMVRNEAALGEQDARALVLVAARPLCPGAMPVLGAFSLNPQLSGAGAAPAGGAAFQLQQEVTCRAAVQPAQTATPAARLTDEQKREIEQEIRIITDRHFRLVAAGNFDVAFRDHDTLVRNLNREAWQFEREAFNVVAGELQKFEIQRVVVLENYQGSPRQGHHFAAEYKNSYANVPIECGFFLWAQVGEGEYRIVNANHRYVTRPHMEKLTPEQLRRLEPMLNCRPGGAATPAPAN